MMTHHVAVGNAELMASFLSTHDLTGGPRLLQ